LPEFEKQILVAGVGDAWMLDDGFGSVVAQRLEGREMPSGVKVMDAGSGGLDLAYEIMRGYHALVLVDVSRQGGEPGEVEDLGLGLSPALEAAVDQAIALVDETIAELRTDAAYKS